MTTLNAQDKIISPTLFQPSADTLAAFDKIERGNLQSFDSVDELFASLHVKD